MSIPTILGFALGIGALLGAMAMEGGNLAAFLSPSAALMVFGGTLGATLASFPASLTKNLPSLIAKSMKKEKSDSLAVSQVLLRLAERARREGLLALEEELPSINDLFLKRGVLLVIDGTDPELVQGILEADLAVRHAELEGESGLFEAMGGYAPTMGIIGTVMGLVNVLGNLSDPSKLGEAIAVAFIATFYGVGSANLMWLPMGSKLKKNAESHVNQSQMIMEGLASIQNGENPRILQERLEAYMPKHGPKKTAKEEAGDGQREGAREGFQPA